MTTNPLVPTKSDVVAFARSVLVKAGHTAWQAGVATGGVLWATTGLHIADLATAHGLSIVFSAVVVGALAAAFSAAKTVVLGSLSRAAESEIQAVGKSVTVGKVVAPEPVVVDTVDTPAPTPEAPSDHPAAG